jgi:phospholipid-binding lipoprotein MlaA
MKTIYKKLHLLLLVVALALGGCSTAPVQKGEPVEPSFSAERLLSDDIKYLTDDISDPWEGFNRSMYRFNYRFDKYIFLPVVSGYQAIAPDFVETGIRNFFANLRDITTFINSVLQVSPNKTVETTGRFLVNTTIGVLGFFDVASRFDFPKHNEDFGQTLGVWGAGWHRAGHGLVCPERAARRAGHEGTGGDCAGCAAGNRHPGEYRVSLLRDRHPV